jgi:DNA-binding transcriptional ArsR family regulator
VSTVGGTRNANVLYEVGLAHAVRQPQEVLLFRSDRDRLLFDLSTVRVNAYDPDRDPMAARRVVGEAVDTALKEVDLRRSLAVERAASALDLTSLEMLLTAKLPDGYQHPELDTVGQVLSTIGELQSLSRLLDAGLVRVEYLDFPSKGKGYEQLRKVARERARYRATPLGRATIEEAMHRLGDSVIIGAVKALGAETPP